MGQTSLSGDPRKPKFVAAVRVTFVAIVRPDHYQERSVRKCLSLVALLALVASRADAQDFASTLIGKIKDFSIYPVFPLSKSANTYSVTGYGFEFSLPIGTWKRPMKADERISYCRKGIHAKSCSDTAAMTDTSFVLAQVRPTRAGADSTFNVVVAPDAFTKNVVTFELAVATENNDVRQNDFIPGDQLTGKIQEFPVLSVYADFTPDKDLSLYLGGRFVQGSLSDMRLTAGDSSATLSTRKAYGGALALGAAWRIQGFDVFLELDQAHLQFATSGWTVPANMSAQAASLPKNIENSGARLMAGVQLHLSEK